MFKKTNLFKPVLIILLVILVVLAQFLSINRSVSASSVSGGNYFFTGSPNSLSNPGSCISAAGNCDALLQYGISNCVISAANDGYFYSNSGANNYTTVTNQDSSITNPDDYRLTYSLLAYYYGVDVSAYVAAGKGTCIIPINKTSSGASSLSDSQIDSLDNIGAAFDILSIV
jgi:hypothetical protein